MLIHVGSLLPPPCSKQMSPCSANNHTMGRRIRDFELLTKVCCVPTVIVQGIHFEHLILGQLRQPVPLPGFPCGSCSLRAFDDRAHMPFGDAVPLGDLPLRKPVRDQKPDGLDVAVRQLCHAVALARC